MIRIALAAAVIGFGLVFVSGLLLAMAGAMALVVKVG